MRFSSYSDDYNVFINEKLMEYLPASRIRSGNDIVFRCPICGDSLKNSLKKRGYYTPSKMIYHCFNCDVSLSGIKLLEILSGSNFSDLKTEYLRLKIKTESKNSKQNHKPFTQSNLSENPNGFSFSNIRNIIKPEWKHPLSDLAKEYLNSRKIFDSPFCKEKFFSYYDTKNNNEYILIPWVINGVEGYYQLNDFQKKDKFGRKYIFPKSDKLIYGLDNIDLSFPYIICFEGVYDSVFVKNGVCIGGKTLTKLQKEIIKKRYPKHQIVLGYDNDLPGFQSSLRAIKESDGNTKFFKWYSVDTKEKDINDLVLNSNNPKLFSEKSVVENLIISSIQMKMFCLEKKIKIK